MIYKGNYERMELYYNTEGKAPEEIQLETGCTTILSGVMFNSDGSLCWDNKLDGDWLSYEGGITPGIAWDKGDFPVFCTGANSQVYGNFISCGYVQPNIPRGRNAVGFNAKGQYIILSVADGIGALTVSQVIDIMSELCVFWIWLDGGGSVYLNCPDGVVDTTAYRKTANKTYLLFWNKEESNSEMEIIKHDLKFAYGPTIRKLTTHCITHHAAWENCTLEQIHQAHLARGWRGIAYNYFIRKDGTIYQGRPENEQGGHTVGMNHCSIGICFEGNFENEWMPQAQMEAGQKLIANIKSRYPEIIVGKHKDYSATACPGKNFPFTFIVNPVEGSPEDELEDPEDYGEPSNWAKEACEWAVENEIFKGYNGEFNWQKPITRESVAVIMKRFNDNLKCSGGTKK